jgi:hypothetical protein
MDRHRRLKTAARASTGLRRDRNRDRNTYLQPPERAASTPQVARVVTGAALKVVELKSGRSAVRDRP